MLLLVARQKLTAIDQSEKDIGSTPIDFVFGVWFSATRPGRTATHFRDLVMRRGADGERERRREFGTAKECLCGA